MVEFSIERGLRIVKTKISPIKKQVISYLHCHIDELEEFGWTHKKTKSRMRVANLSLCFFAHCKRLLRGCDCVVGSTP